MIVRSPGRIPNEINFARLNLSVALTLCAPATQTVRYWRMLRVSDTADDENRKTCWPIPVAGPMRHDGEVLSAQFSADRQRVATASGDNTVRVWDEASGKTIGEPMRHDDAVFSAQFSADGQRVVTGLRG
jgi:WD40 repeat protein